MNKKRDSGRKHKVVVLPSEAVVTDQRGRRIISCPTEDEAWEYIREMEKKSDED